MLTVTKAELKESKKITKQKTKKNTFARCQQPFFFGTVRVVSRQVTRLQKLQMHLSIHIRNRSVSVNIQVSM